MAQQNTSDTTNAVAFAHASNSHKSVSHFPITHLGIIAALMEGAGEAA
jgi:hypothetical protein